MLLLLHLNMVTVEGCEFGVELTCLCAGACINEAYSVQADV